MFIVELLNHLSLGSSSATEIKYATITADTNQITPNQSKIFILYYPILFFIPLTDDPHL